MKWLLIFVAMLATPASAKTVCPSNAICPTCKPICFDDASQFSYTEATLANAPPWMKYNCHRREHQWAAYYHRYSMCR